MSIAHLTLDERRIIEAALYTFAELDRLRHTPIEWDNVIIRQMIECVRVLPKHWLRISFRVGGGMEAHLTT